MPDPKQSEGPAFMGYTELVAGATSANASSTLLSGTGLTLLSRGIGGSLASASDSYNDFSFLRDDDQDDGPSSENGENDEEDTGDNTNGECAGVVVRLPLSSWCGPRPLVPPRC